MPTRNGAVANFLLWLSVMTVVSFLSSRSCCARQKTIGDTLDRIVPIEVHQRIHFSIGSYTGTFSLQRNSFALRQFTDPPFGTFVSARSRMGANCAEDTKRCRRNGSMVKDRRLLQYRARPSQAKCDSHRATVRNAFCHSFQQPTTLQSFSRATSSASDLRVKAGAGKSK